MKIELLQENLSLALNQVKKALPNKSALPLLESVLLSVGKEKITISATDLYIGIKSSVLGKIEKTGSIAVPGKIFIETINSMPPGKIKLFLRENTLEISSPGNKVKLQTQGSDDYPEFPESKGESFMLPLNQVEAINKLVSFSVSKDQTRPVLTALLFDFLEKDLQVVATDGFRLAKIKFSQKKKQEKKRFIIPAVAFSEITKVARQTKAKKIELRVSKELKQVFFTSQDVELFIRLIEGDFPPFEQIIPLDLSTQVLVDAKSLLELIKRALVFARTSSNIINLKLDKEKIVVSSSSSAYGDFSGDTPTKLIQGEGGEISFNAKYITDFLSAVKEESVVFSMNESLKPAVLKLENKDFYQYVIMPFRVNQ